MIKVLIDINVILDVLEKRKRFYLDSFSVLNLCSLGVVEGWISADSHSMIHYLLKKELKEFKARKKIVHNLKSLSVVPVRSGTLDKAFELELPDFEDNIKIASAQSLNLDYIVSRNINNFKDSPIKAFTPKEFIEKIKSDLLLPKIKKVPFLDLKAQHHQIYNDIDDRFADIMANTGFILGKYVDEFEKGFAKLQDIKHCIGVSSGTDALHIAMLSLGIGAGDLVIVPVNTFIATAEPVTLCGAEPVFADCDQYFNIDTAKLEKHIGNMEEGKRKRLKAVIPVHLYGQPADMDEISRIADQYGLDIIEDACQAHLAEYKGKKVGTMGKFGAFSFYPGKNLGAWGEAGALITDDEKLFLKAKQIRQHGEIERYHHSVVGHNYRMSAFQGAALSVKIKYIAEWTAKRQGNARLYKKYLAEIPGIETPEEKDGCDSVFHLFVIQTENRDELQKYLQENGVASGLHYPVPLHLQKAYKYLGYTTGNFPVAEKAARRILSLPMYPELTKEAILYVCEKISEWIKK